MISNNLNIQIIKFFFITSMFILYGCKSITVLPTNKPISNVNINALIDKINTNTLNFKNFKSRIRVIYDDGKNKEQIIVQMRVKSDEIIWLSATMLVPIAKAIISKDKLRFYERFQKTYYDGEITAINSILKTKINYNKLENLLLGKSFVDLNNNSWKQISNSKNYILISKGRNNMFNPTLFFNPVNFLLEEQRIFLPEISEVLRIQYLNFINISDNNIPQTIKLSIVYEGILRSIEIDLSNINFPEKLNFPFEIPKGYKKLDL